MAADYPDWTSMVQIVGSDVDLDVNLVASEITVDVNIAASDVTLNVNLEAQDININIDIEAQSVGLYSYPEWAAKEGEDKNFSATGSLKGWAEYVREEYTVPTGKVLYICGMSFAIFASLGDDYDHHLHFSGSLYDATDATPVLLAPLGGNGGGSIIFSKPIAFTADKKMRLNLMNASGVDCNLYAACWGYEIDV